MKASVTIFRQGLRELTTARNVTLTIIVLGVLAGSVQFFQTTPKPPPATTFIPPRTNSPAIGPTSGDVAASAETDVAPLPRAIRAIDQSPSLVPSGGAASPPAVEISLPPPPSGDYELNLTAEQINAIVDKRYGGLLQGMDLPPEQLDRLRRLLVERQQATVDAANAALLNGVNPVRELPTIRSAIEQAQASVDAQIRHELGESVFAACRDFDRTLGERNSAGDLARLLTETGEPLRPEQEKQVLQILKTFPGKDSPVDIDRAIFGGINARARISDRAIAESATVLSPSQLELLRQLQQHAAAEDSRH